MTMRRGSRRGSRRTGTKRPTIWEQVLITTLQNASSLTFADVSPNQILADGRGEATLLRLIGHWSATTNAGPVQYDVALGLSIVTFAAIEGATDFPGPIADDDQSWYFWDNLTGRLQDDDTSANRDFDIRSARKIRQGFRMALMFQTGSAHSAATEVNFEARLLWTKP